MRALFAIALCFLCVSAFAQLPPNRQAGVYIATAYNYDIDSSFYGAFGPYTFTRTACTNAVSLGTRALDPFNVNASVTATDSNPANTETVAFLSQNLNGGLCILQLAVTHPHVSYHLSSGTFGLQEAINDATQNGGGNIVVDSKWRGTTGMITGAAGNATVSITDNRTGSATYTWNGAVYVLINTGGGLPTGVAPGSIVVSNGVAQPAVYQAKSVIDARDIAGVDCTGATDSSTALNALTVTDGITRKTLSFRSCPSIKLTSQWLIKGQLFAEIDLGGTFGQGSEVNSAFNPQGGTTIFGCSGTADAVIRIDDTGFSYFHGGTIEAKGPTCTSSFTGGIRVTNSGTGGYSPSRNTFSHIGLYSNIGGQQVANFTGINVDNGPNQEGYGFHHIQVFCQNSSASVGILINDLTADSTDIDQESHVTGCYQGIKIGALGGVARVSHSHIGGNGSFATFGAGGSNFYESALGCFVEISNVIAAETSGAFLNGPGTNGQACFRTFYNNQIGFPNIDPSLYPIRAQGGSFSLWNNDFGNGGITIAIHNNSLLGDDANGLNGPVAGVFDLGGNNLTDTGNTGAFQLLYQSLQRSEVFLGSTGPVNNLANGISTPSGGISNDWALLPNGNANGASTSYPSSRLIFSRSLVNASTPSYDQFAFRSVGGSTNSFSTLALTYRTPAGYSITPTMGIQPSLSGLTFAQVAAPTFDGVHSNVTNVGTAGSTTYTYVIVARGGCGTSAASGNGTTTTGNSSLSSTNYNVIHLDSTAGAWGIDVYRTVGGASQGKIGTALATDYDGGGTSFLTFNDTGLTGDATTAPTVNNSGCVQLPSVVFANLGTATNGTLIYCSDCKNAADDSVAFDSTATGSGHGTNVLRENGAWRVH
jgi:hypothetical protein